eukprot:c17484_g1_i2.p1 GENE.c17484_g1_i2~~c17484_g1_i2.p1  ORF type:complete len:141 (-),score=28.63 c17484_g1_i2:524-946(-)
MFEELGGFEPVTSPRVTPDDISTKSKCSAVITTIIGEGRWDLDSAWQSIKRMNTQQKRVLCVSLAHLRALKTASDSPFHLILEDNVRFDTNVVPTLHQALEHTAVEGSPFGMVLAGYLGANKNLEKVHSHLHANAKGLSL